MLKNVIDPDRYRVFRLLMMKLSVGWNEWRPVRDLNPCYRRERAMSWTGLDERDAISDVAAHQRCGASKNVTESVTGGCDEGQMILIRRLFVNGVCQLSGIARFDRLLAFSASC